MKIPQPILSEMHSKQPCHKLGRLSVKYGIGCQPPCCDFWPTNKASPPKWSCRPQPPIGLAYVHVLMMTFHLCVFPMNGFPSIEP